MNNEVNKLIIECESSSVQFIRQWMPFDLLENKEIGIFNKNK